MSSGNLSTAGSTSGAGTPCLASLAACWTWHTWSRSRRSMQHHKEAAGLVLPFSHSFSLGLPHYTSQWGILSKASGLLNISLLLMDQDKQKLSQSRSTSSVPFSIISHTWLKIWDLFPRNSSLCAYIIHKDFIVCFPVVTDLIIMAPRRDAQNILPEVVWIKTLRPETWARLDF